MILHYNIFTNNNQKLLGQYPKLEPYLVNSIEDRSRTHIALIHNAIEILSDDFFLELEKFQNVLGFQDNFKHGRCWIMFNLEFVKLNDYMFDQYWEIPLRGVTQFNDSLWRYCD